MVITYKQSFYTILSIDILHLHVAKCCWSTGLKLMILNESLATAVMNHH